MSKVIVRLMADLIVVAIALFATAGTLMWWRAWILLAVLFTVRLVGARAVFRVNPTLLLERAKLPIHRGQSFTDKFLVSAVLATGFVGLPAIAGIDRFHWHALPTPNSILSALGLALYAAGWSIKSMALHANAFAVAAVRVQHERKHAVVDTGIYGKIRHPIYAADPLIFIGLGLWLQSYVVVLCTIVPIGLVIVRLLLEEQVLHRELPGYSDYMQRVRHRMMLGVW